MTVTVDIASLERRNGGLGFCGEWFGFLEDCEVVSGLVD